MADDPFENLRLYLMQEFLPVGLAMAERVKKGGASQLVEVFTTSPDPLKDLREEGEPAARSLRERLDQVSPGLGNPVVSVTVEVADDEEEPVLNELVDQNSLHECLHVIEDRLKQLEDLLQDSQSDLPDLSLTDKE